MQRFVFELGRAFRETGQFIDQIGLRSINKPIFKEPFSRHRSVMNLFNKHPVLENNAFVAPSATVVGRVQILDSSSVWYGAVVRGDFNAVEIGAFTSIGSGAVVQTSPTSQAKTRIGDNVQIGAGAVLQSCTVENGASIGAGAVIMEGALVESGAAVGAGAVVHPDQRVPSGQLWAGNPAKLVRNLNATEAAGLTAAADNEVEAAKEHADVFFPAGTAYREAEDLSGTYLEDLQRGKLFTQQKPKPQL